MRKVLFIFSVLTDGDVEWLARAGERVHCDPGMALIPLGARVDYLYFVLEGRLAIKTKSGDPIAYLESGEIIGEMSLVDPAPTTVSVEVAADTTLLRIPDGVVRDKLLSDPPFAAPEKIVRARLHGLDDRAEATRPRCRPARPAP